LPDGFFHVTSRGVARCRIFRDADDCHAFLGLFADTVTRYGWDVWAFCLMHNHYHVVLEATQVQLSAGMQWLNGVYAQDFNQRYERWGHLFGARFSSWVIEDEEHLRAACLYVLANPVRAGLCKTPEEWPWSGSRWGLRLA
jgi:REP element-mobilizing transposase RayT